MKMITQLPEWAIPILRLWTRETPLGTYWKGKIGGMHVFVFANPAKEKDPNAADFIACLAANKEEFDVRKLHLETPPSST